MLQSCNFMDVYALDFGIFVVVFCFHLEDILMYKDAILKYQQYLQRLRKSECLNFIQYISSVNIRPFCTTLNILVQISVWHRSFLVLRAIVVSKHINRKQRNVQPFLFVKISILLVIIAYLHKQQHRGKVNESPNSQNPKIPLYFKNYPYIPKYTLLCLQVCVSVNEHLETSHRIKDV